MGFITKEEAEAAKSVNILDRILPEATQYSDILAPHFVLEVRKQLEDKYGISTMRAGGWTITTTLDYRAQKIAEEAGAEIVGIGAVIEKGFQGAGDKLRAQGVDLYSLAVIDKMEDGKIVFRK